MPRGQMYVIIYIAYAGAKSRKTGGHSWVQMCRLAGKFCAGRPSVPTLLHFVPLLSFYLQNRIGK